MTDDGIPAVAPPQTVRGRLHPLDRAYQGRHAQRARPAAAMPTCRRVPIGAFIRCARVENFPITGVPVGHYPDFVRALVLVKQAAARANRRLGHLPVAKAEAIDRACDLIAKEGRYHDQFVVDAVQGGAGTSTNMNTNEVIANVALELMGHKKGEYSALHPNDDVNMAQSTNDAYPTALRLAIIFASGPLVEALDELALAFKYKAVEFGNVLKIGRTQLQDAVPMTLGQEFDGFFATIKEDISRLKGSRGIFPHAGQSRRHRDRNRHQCRSALRRARDRGTRAPLARVDGARRQSDRGDLRHGRLCAVFGRAQTHRRQTVEDLQRFAIALQRPARRLWRDSPADRFRPAPRSCRARSIP